MKKLVVVVWIAAAAVALAGCPPDFGALPFPDAGVTGDGEGEDGGCAIATSLTPWRRVDIFNGDDQRASAMVGGAERVFIGLSDGRVFALESGAENADEITSCNDGGGAGLLLRHMFLQAGLLIASGPGGVCIIDPASVNPSITLVGNGVEGVDVAAIPISDDGQQLLVVHADGASFAIEVGTLDSNGFIDVRVPLLPDVPAPVPDDAHLIEAAALVGGALFADEVGRVYIVEGGASPSVRLVAALGGVPARGLILAAHRDLVEVALNTGDELRQGSLALADVRAGAITAGDIVEHVRAPVLFPHDRESVESVAVRSDGLRIDTGSSGFVTLTAPGTAPRAPFPIGTMVRVADIVSLSLAGDGPLWALTSAGAVIVWQRALIDNGDWTTKVTGAGRAPGFDWRHIVALPDGEHALIATGGGLALATRTVDDELNVDTGVDNGSIVGIAIAADGIRAAYANISGEVFVVDTSDFDNSEQGVSPDLLNDAPSNDFALLMVLDRDTTSGDDIGFIAAGMFDAQPGLKRCSVDIAGRTLSCGLAEPLNIPLGAKGQPQLARAAFTSAGIVVLADTGVALERGGAFVAVDVSEFLVESLTPFNQVGDVVDLGGSCLALFGSSRRVYGLDASAAGDLALIDALAAEAPDPPMTSALAIADGLIVGSSGNGNVFYELPYASAATSCAQALSLTPPRALLPERPSVGVDEAAFVGCDAVVADDLGDLWVLPMSGG